MYLLLGRRKKLQVFIVKYACRPDGGWWSSPPSAHKMFQGLFTYSHCTANGFKVTFLLQNRKTPPLSLPIDFCLKIHQIGCCKTSVLVITTFTITFICVHIEKLYIPISQISANILLSGFFLYQWNTGILK